MKLLATSAAMAMLLGGCGGSPIQPEKSRGDNAAAINVQLGYAYLQQGNLSLAKEKFERAETQNPRDPNVHSALAILYERLGKTKEVDEHFRTALRLAPHNPEISNNYAVYLCRNGRTEEGLRRFRTAAEDPLYRTPDSAYTNAGVCLRNAGRLDDAEANFKRALLLRPNSAEAAYQFSDLQFTRGRVKDARTQVDQYLASYDATPELLLLGVRTAHALGDRLAAEKYARRLRVEFPGSAQVRAIPSLDQNPG
jgi:type IV pilus assembly protein PilF